MFFIFFFFKQKTAYEMRISDWSSDVCSSDLVLVDIAFVADADDRRDAHTGRPAEADDRHADAAALRRQRDLALDVVGRAEGRAQRSEERRGGKECVRTCSSRWSA